MQQGWTLVLFAAQQLMARANVSIRNELKAGYVGRHQNPLLRGKALARKSYLLSDRTKEIATRAAGFGHLKNPDYILPESRSRACLYTRDPEALYVV